MDGMVCHDFVNTFPLLTTAVPISFFGFIFVPHLDCDSTRMVNSPPFLSLDIRLVVDSIDRHLHVVMKKKIE
jgi:hypothetical protein